MRSFWLPLLLITAVASGQTVDTAQRIYKSSQDSVFLVYLNDSSGSPAALGSAFVVAKRTLVTNAHVADAGSPVLAVGPVRLPLKVVRIDRKNDLAVLSVDVDLTSTSLPLATGTVSPGEQVFAIGNPEGLEKTISQGIVSGLRQSDDRDLIQITSPISHGSSGGPILNSDGEVIGVAVGALEDGQNLNFAVPVKYVRSLLEAKADIAPVDLRSGITEIESLAKNRGEYSSEDDSEYQRSTKRLIALMDSIVPEATTEKDLRNLACIGTTDTRLSDAGIKAAQKLSLNNPSLANRALLAYVLYDRADNESVAATFADKGSKEMADATAARDRYLNEAEHEAGDLVRRAKGDDLLIATFVLGNVSNDREKYDDAISLHSTVATKPVSVCGIDVSEVAAKALIDENENAHHPEEAEKWFRRYAAANEPNPYEWNSEAERRVDAADISTAADAYEKAASASSYYGQDYCYASNAFFFSDGNHQDEVLSNGRKCIDASVKATGDAESEFKTALPLVYEHMADVLNQRGVYQQAFEYAKESLSLKPDDASILDTEADSLFGLERYSECIAAENAAIRASDGKYPYMQFRLGTCYFSSEDWSHAATSFRLAATTDKSNAAAAFNLALSLQNQGYSGDAQQWFREALNRKPDAETRAAILRQLK